MARRQAKKPVLESLVSNWIPILTFATGIGLFGYNFAAGVANKPYVDAKFIEANKYTDEKMRYAVELAVSHSDANRKDMMLKMEEMNSERQKENATLTAKVDMLLENIRNIDAKTSRSH